MDEMWRVQERDWVSITPKYQNSVTQCRSFPLIWRGGYELDKEEGLIHAQIVHVLVSLLGLPNWLPTSAWCLQVFEIIAMHACCLCWFSAHLDWHRGIHTIHRCYWLCKSIALEMIVSLISLLIYSFWLVHSTFALYRSSNWTCSYAVGNYTILRPLNSYSLRRKLWSSRLDAGCLCQLDPSWIIHLSSNARAAPEPFETRCTPWLPVAQEQRNYVATFFERGEQATSTQRDGGSTQAWSKSVRPLGLWI